MSKLAAFLGRPVVTVPLRLVLAAMFLYAAPPKILDAAGFAVSVDNYHFLPTPLVNLWALFLPWTELFVGALLLLSLTGARIFDRATKAAGLLSSLMYLSFVIALAWALAKHLNIDCGCFSTKGTAVINYWYLLRDGSLLCASVIVFFFPPRKEIRRQ